ncbi:ABC transporter ATP-binding protein [Vibrio sp. 10N.261.55.A7]|uniref:ABC transporter ATP-binding protein n=1 Tax=Vibrio sp. 10N.261.55.A7 TaxID=1880851 RepID=UPI000C84C3CF|nr:ABC transporter ATP-binding protein [Vibrio sp. 10N.261.55.A7]PMJ99980.1 spermidine/putrescine ABC transporter ATP-binding protein [Vibrio sp. 10N.261.55.A7]
MDPNAEHIVSFDGIQKSYDGENYVVKDLNFKIRRGEFLTLLGPSGSGKSTSLMMLAGFEPPTYGDICLNGTVINKIPPHKRDIGMVFQNYALFPHMSVEENVAFPLQVRKAPKHEMASKVKKALDMVHLGDFASRKPSQLSGGQQQRVALARALVFEPKLVLLDEPLGALDKNLRENMQLELKHIHENLGVTMVFVTHDQDEALIMSDRIAVFNDGIIQQADQPDVLYNNPSNQFVANFIGETNMLDGHVSNVSDESCQVKLNCGSIVTVDHDKKLSIGSSVKLSIRPEQAEVLSTDAESYPLNKISARAVETIYHGDHLRLSLQRSDGSNFTVKIPTDSLHSTLQRGQELEIGFAQNNARILTA